MFQLAYILGWHIYWDQDADMYKKMLLQHNIHSLMNNLVNVQIGTLSEAGTIRVEKV